MASRPISPAAPPRIRQPNAHPYAVKTTSSALSSRSNSSPHSAHHTRHHYIPSQPSRIPTGTRVRHHHSSSSSSSVEGNASGRHTNPASLPTPSPTAVALLNPADELRPTRRVRTRRADTMPNSITEGYDQKHEFDHGHKPEHSSCLPSNPEEWNTDQLITYLHTSFCTTNGEKDDSGLADILECVRTRGFTGRELLRLTDADLASMPISDVQRAQLLERSRTLRADVLRGRILYHSRESSDNLNKTRSRSIRSSAPFHSNHGASVSADDLRLLFDSNTRENPLIPSAVTPLHRSNSISDASAQRYRDLARMRLRCRGNVKGLVETWERASTSGSECSASDAESDSETDPQSASISDTDSSEPPCNLSHALPVLSNESPSLDPPPPYPHVHNKLESGAEDDEPSIEDLLAASSDIPITGAGAWEADFGLGDTVKRIPVSLSVDAGVPLPSLTESRFQGNRQSTKNDSLSSKRSEMRSGSIAKNAEIRNRVVTAIFTGSPSDDLAENAHSKDHHRYASDAKGVVREVAAGPDLRNDTDLRVLEESVAATRAQLETFRLRLEQVETDIARQEAVLVRAKFSDSGHCSDDQARRRQTEINEQIIVEAAGSPRGKSFAEGAANKDALESWETMSLPDIARAIVVKAMGWAFPYGHLGVQVLEGQASAGTHLATNDKTRFPAKRGGRLPVARMSCGIILVSFAVCAVVLRRTGLGRWVRRP